MDKLHVVLTLRGVAAQEAQTLQQALQSQLMDSGSELLSGTVTSDIQNPSGVRVTMGQAQNQQCGEAAWCAPNCCSTLDGGGSGVGNFAIFVDNAFDAHVSDALSQPVALSASLTWRASLFAGQRRRDRVV